MHKEHNKKKWYIFSYYFLVSMYSSLNLDPSDLYFVCDIDDKQFFLKVEM